VVNNQTKQPSSTDHDSNESISNCRPNTEKDDADEPPLKRFKHLERVSKLLDIG